MKKLTLLMLFSATTLLNVLHSQTITIGTGNVTTSSSPCDPNFGYSYVQTIYLQSDINATGSITSIQYYYNGTALTNSSQVKVYMANITRSTFASTTDWETLTNLSLVFDGTLAATTLPGWVTITLATPFAYDNTKNLLIAVDENTAGSDAGRFTGTSATGRVIHYRNTATNPDPASPPTGTIASTFGNIKIDGLSAITPVTFNDVHGERDSKYNNIYWTTQMESNNRLFEIERSIDGSHYSKIGSIASKAPNGNSNTTINYSFTDEHPFGNTTYYRIKQLDRDGKFSYSAAISIQAVSANGIKLSVAYPNPVKDNLHMAISVSAQQQVEINVVDQNGKIQVNNNYSLIKGDNTVTINTVRLTPGMYFVKLQNKSGEIVSASFVKE